MNSHLMAPPLSRRTIEQYALYIREQLGLDKKLYIPIMRIVEHILPKMDPTFQIVTLYESEMSGEYANYRPQDNTLSIRQDVYVAACNDDPRHRFTIAHELGHYFIHDDITAFSRCGQNDSIPAYRDPEWQANVFAASLLMPGKLIKGMSAAEVSWICKTSLQSAEIALKCAC